MKHKLLAVVLVIAVLSIFSAMGAQAVVPDSLAKSHDMTAQYHRLQRAQLVYSDSMLYETAGTAFQVSSRSGIRKLRFRMA